MTELKRCPFCGGTARVCIEAGVGVWVECTKCKCGTAYMQGASTLETKIQVATKDWNRRTNDA